MAGGDRDRSLELQSYEKGKEISSSRRFREPAIILTP
jgi:hypothetical protein